MTPETYWNCRFSIADIRNSEKRPLHPIGAEFRFSSFDFLLSQSSIGNQQSTMKTCSLGCGYAALSDSAAPNLPHGLAALNRRQA
jgi:hypothetical protein